MKNLFITSINPGVGKSTFTLALALKLRQEGHNVGYFKPITDNKNKDTDAKDAKELLEMKEDLSVINPVMISSFEYDMTQNQREEIIKKLKQAYQSLASAYDFLLIEGCQKINYLAFLQLSADILAEMFDAKVLLVSSGQEIGDVDRLILGKKYMEHVIGAVFTMVPDELFQHFKTLICPILEEKFGIPVFGLIPNRATLVAPTVEEIKSAVNARVLAGEEFLNKPVEDYIVGAMEPEAALKYFRKSINKAVITGGDRPQVALAAMETDTSVIILTGSILPPAGVLARAEEKEIPILLVADDTFNTVRKLTQIHLYGKLHQDQREKIQAWDTIFNDVGYNQILALLE